MNAAFPARDERLEWIDALRGISILAVVLTHVPEGEGVWRFVACLSWCGAYGVQLFFVVSAYTLVRSFARRHREPCATGAFFLRRLFRIFPLYWVGIALYAALAFLVGQDWLSATWVEDYTFGKILANALLVHGAVPAASNYVVPGGWSIGTEVLFYLAAPCLFLVVASPARAWTAWFLSVPLALVSAFAAVRLGVPECRWPVQFMDFNYRWLPAQMPVFMAGFVAYFTAEGWRGLAPAAQRTRSLLCLAGAFAILAGIALWFTGDDMPPGYRWFYGIAPALVGAAGALLVLALFLRPWRILVNPVTCFLGRLSYALYLVHFVAMVPGERIFEGLAPRLSPTGAHVATWLLCTALAVPAAWLLHRFVEQPGIALGKAVILRMQERRKPSAA